MASREVLPQVLGQIAHHLLGVLVELGVGEASCNPHRSRRNPNLPCLQMIALGAILMDINEERLTGRKHLSMD